MIYIILSKVITRIQFCFQCV